MFHVPPHGMHVFLSIHRISTLTALLILAAVSADRLPKWTTPTDIFFALKGSTKAGYIEKTLMAIDMYLGHFVEPLVVVDSADPDGLKRLYQQAHAKSIQVDSTCPPTHGQSDLCCKTEKAMAAIEDRVDSHAWFCYVDDDHYVAAPKLLAYLGSEDPEKAQIILAQCTKDGHPCESFCMSRAAARELNGTLHTCSKSKLADDMWLSQIFNHTGISRYSSSCFVSEHAHISSHSVLKKAIVIPHDMLSDVREFHDTINNFVEKDPSKCTLTDREVCSDLSESNCPNFIHRNEDS